MSAGCRTDCQAVKLPLFVQQEVGHQKLLCMNLHMHQTNTIADLNKLSTNAKMY